MKFDPTKEDDLIPDGSVCMAVVDKAEDKVSKAGKPMMQIGLKVWDSEGLEYFIDDYWSSKFKKKMADFLRATGQEDVWESGECFPEHVIGRTVGVRISVQKGGPRKDAEGKETGKFFWDKNVVEKYVPWEGGATLAAPAPTSEPEEDVPF